MLEALRQRAARLTGDPKLVAARLEPARLDVLRGRFDRAEAHGKALAREIDSSPNARAHAAAATLLVELLLETGRHEEAGKIAAAFLGRSAAWNHDGAVDDGVLPMLAARLASGQLRAEEARARAAKWVAEKERTSYVMGVPYLWVWAFAPMADSRADAERALGEQKLPFPRGQGYVPVIPARALYGRLLALAGRDGARRELLAATKSCAPLEDPFAHTRAHLWLGEALEAAGDKRGACAALAVVTARWGKVRPRSRSAERAERILTRLGCAREGKH